MNIRVSLCGMLRLIRVDALRIVHSVGFSRRTALMYGGTEVTCVCFYLSRAHDILSRAQEILCLAHEIIKSCTRDTKSCARDIKSCARDNKSCARDTMSCARDN